MQKELLQNPRITPINIDIWFIFVYPAVNEQFERWNFLHLLEGNGARRMKKIKKNKQKKMLIIHNVRTNVSNASSICYKMWIINKKWVLFMFR